MKVAKFFLPIVIGIALSFAFYLYFLLLKGYKYSLEDFWSREAKNGEANASIESENTETKSESLKISGRANQSSESFINYTYLSTQQRNYTRKLRLGIVDICSGKLENVFSISEGTRKCLNSPPPYEILLEKNSTHIITRIIDNTGFYEIFDINDTVLIYFLFVEDVSNISTEIDGIYLSRNDYFFLGDYELQTVWEADPHSNLYISKVILIMSLYVKKEIKDGRYELSFYLSASNKSFLLGSMKVEVASKE